MSAAAKLFLVAIVCLVGCRDPQESESGGGNASESGDPALSTDGSVAGPLPEDIQSIRTLAKAILLGQPDDARVVCVAEADLTGITPEDLTDEAVESVNEFVDEAPVKCFAVSDELRLDAIHIYNLDYAVPMVREGDEFRCDPRWLIASISEAHVKQRSDPRVLTAKSVLAGFITRDSRFISQFAKAHEDNWMFSYGPELPGADRAIFMEVVVETPFVILQTGERYFDDTRKLQTVLDDQVIAFALVGGLKQAIVALPLEQGASTSGWRADAQSLLKPLRVALADVDPAAAQREIRLKSAKRRFNRVLFGRDTAKDLAAFLQEYSEQQVRDEMLFVVLNFVANDPKGRSEKANDVMARLLDADADPDAMQGRHTALSYACELSEDGGLQIVRLLLKAGANPEKSADRDNDPLHLARLSGSTKVEQLLLESIKQQK